MRTGYIGIMVVLLGIGACKTTKAPAPEVVVAQSGNESTLVEEMASEVVNGQVKAKMVSDFTDSDNIKAIMDFLASDELKGRDSGSPGLEEAAEYIQTLFENNGVVPFFESYRDTLSNFEATTYNMVGLVPGNDATLKEEFIVIGAHYDHIGEIKANNGDAIANGANDNASGTTAVLELARYFGKMKTNKRSLVFALFSAEEKGLLGSKHLAKKLKDQGLSLYVMLNYEMIGVPMVAKDHLVYLTGYEMSNLPEISNAHAGEKVVGFLPKAKEFNLYKRSDNYPFHEAFSVPSHTFSTFDFTNFEHYHGVGDEVQEMDFEHMAVVVNKMIPIVEGIANTTEKEITLK